MTIADAKTVVGLPVGAKQVRKSDGTLPTVRYVGVGPTLLANGDFEADASGWSALNGATLTRDTGTKKVGTGSLKIVRGSANETAAVAARFAAAGGAIFAFGAWVQGAGASLIAYWYDAAGSNISSTQISMSAVSAGFDYLTDALTAPPRSASCELRLIVTSGTAYFDAITAQPCALLPESPFAEPTAGNFAGGSLAYAITPAAHHLGDVKAFDMGTQTDITLPEASFTRVYGRRHAYAGSLLVDTGILRVAFKPNGGASAALSWSILVHGSWQAAKTLLVDTAGDTPATIATFSVVRLTRGLVIVNVLDTDGNQAAFTFRRGAHAVQIDTTRSAAVQAYQELEVDADSRFRVYNLSTVAKDNVLTPGSVAITGSTLTEPGALALDTANPYLLILAMTRKPSTLNADGTTDWRWKDTAATTSAFKRTFWLIVIPWPWTLGGAIFNEAESGTLAGGATSVADASASGGNAAQLAAQNAQTTITFIAGRALPLGDYSLVMLATDTNHVASDLDMRVRNTTDSVTLATATKTLTGAYLYYVLDFSLTATDNGDTIELRALKSTATANTIKVDYFLIIPRARNASSPAHAFFPKDIAHNALMTVTSRDSIQRA